MGGGVYTEKMKCSGICELRCQTAVHDSRVGQSTEVGQRY